MFNVLQCKLRKHTKSPVPKDLTRDCHTWAATPGSGLEKRQCNLQVCSSLNANTKVKIAIIFRGSGKRITNHEKQTY